MNKNTANISFLKHEFCCFFLILSNPIADAELTVGRAERFVLFASIIGAYSVVSSHFYFLKAGSNFRCLNPLSFFILSFKNAVLMSLKSTS